MNNRNKTKNIGIITSSFLPNIGGVEVGLHNIAINLIRKKYKPIIFTSWKHKYQLKKNKIMLPYKIISFPPRFFYLLEKFPDLFLIFSHLILSYWKKKYDIYFWHGTFCYPIGVILGFHYERSNKHFLIRAVGEDIQVHPQIKYGLRLNPLIDNLVRKYIPKCPHLIATTNTMKKEFVKLGVNVNKISRIPNGIDLKRLKNHKSIINLREKLGIKKDKFVFLSVGRYHEKKNFFSIIKAAMLLKNFGFNNFKCLIVGSEIFKLKNEIITYKAEKYVELFQPENLNITSNNFLNLPSNQLLDYYSIADCFIMPSLIESFGIVTIEAMAFGLPVIISNAPGNIDIVRHGQDGLLYDDDNKGLKLSLAMKKIITDKKLFLHFKKKSVQRVKKFDWQNIVDNYCKIYEKSINKK